MVRFLALVSALPLALACASTPPAAVPGPPDWGAVSGEKVPRLVTRDADLKLQPELADIGRLGSGPASLHRTLPYASHCC